MVDHRARTTDGLPRTLMKISFEPQDVRLGNAQETHVPIPDPLANRMDTDQHAYDRCGSVFRSDCSPMTLP